MTKVEHTLEAANARLRHDMLAPLTRFSSRYWIAVGLCLVVIAFAGFAWANQLAYGIGVAGIRRPVYWGFYIINFVFWIGISHAGTLISAILRLTDAGWRKPVTRAAEAITVFALMIGGLFPIIHLGRAWLFYWLIPYPNERLLWVNFRSPLLWDMVAIFTYVSGSLLYLYLPMIPDLAMMGRRFGGLRGKIYRALAIGWRGSDRQWHALEFAMKLMAAIILAVAVSVHSVVAFDFSMAVAPMWHSTILAPYFVAGAIFSGIAALIIALASLRKFLRLEAYLKPLHFHNLSKLLLLMCILWAYFTVSDHLTTWYGGDPLDMRVFNAREHGPYAFWFWLMVVCNFVVPFVLLSIKKLRTIPTIIFSSCTVLLGMWLERFLIVVPTLANPPLAAAAGSYTPSWVELAITAGTFAGMVLLYLVFTRLVPIIAVWEYEHETIS